MIKIPNTEFGYSLYPRVRYWAFLIIWFKTKIHYEWAKLLAQRKSQTQTTSIYACSQNVKKEKRERTKLHVDNK